MKYHFIGIKGSGMSALANILKETGHEVTGSERDNHDANRIKAGQIVVHSAAIPEDNIELIKAEELGLKIFSYPEMLGRLTREYQTVAISGCHGKTTTTNIVTHLLKSTIGCNYLIGDGRGGTDKNNDLLVIEACEYRRHFLKYFPEYTIITNIDLDHVDYFKDMDDVIDAYQSLVAKTKRMVIACGDCSNVRELKLTKQHLYYGFNFDNDIIATNVKQTPEGTSFAVIIKGRTFEDFFIPLPGKHMVLNSLAAIAIGYSLDLNMEDIKEKLISMPIAKRRFNEVIINDTVVIDDYAHQTSEINVTIEAARQKYPDQDIIAAFWPHTFSRTERFYKEIGSALSNADHVYVLDIFPAREQQADYPNVSAQLIINEVSGAKQLAFDNLGQLTDHKNSVIIFMSPRDISEYHEELTRLIKEKE